MPVNFYDAIPFFDGWVAAMGTQDPRDEIKEICVWIRQSLPDGAGDAAATEMSTHQDEGGQDAHFVQVAGKRWLLPVKKISAGELRPGRATAVALALVVEDRKGKAKERFVWWSQAVELQENEGLVNEARAAVELAAVDKAAAEEMLKGTLGNPLPFLGL